MGEPTLHVVTKGEDASLPRIAFCHGLFGQGRNWTAISKAVSDVARPTLVDMPDHGRSPWSEQFDYVEMADAVADTLRAIDDSAPWIVVGHSMGGKASMIMALRHPDLVSRLCVVDVSPVGYREGREFEHFVASMRGKAGVTDAGTSAHTPYRRTSTRGVAVNHPPRESCGPGTYTTRSNQRGDGHS